MLIDSIRRLWREFGWGHLTITAVCLSIASLGGFLNIHDSSVRFWRWAAWAAELSSNFRLHYFVVLSFLLLLFWTGHKYKRSLFIGVFALLNLTLLLPLYATPRPPAGNQTYLTLMLNAGQLKNAAPPDIELIGTTEPDIFVLLEVGREAPAAYESLRSAYPYSTYSPGKEIYDGSLVYSKLPFAVDKGRQGQNQTESSPVTQVKLGKQTLTLIATQTRAPMHPARTLIRRIQMEQLGLFIAQQSEPVLLLGDLNTTIWSPIISDLLRISGLHDGRNGFGLQASWPTFMPYFLAVPIDHGLVSTDIDVHNFVNGPRVGSDHYPILVDFSLSTGGEKLAQ